MDADQHTEAAMQTTEAVIDIRNADLNQTPAFWTMDEYAEYFRKTYRSAQRDVSSGIVKSVKVGGRRVIPRSEVARLVNGLGL